MRMAGLFPFQAGSWTCNAEASKAEPEFQRLGQTPPDTARCTRPLGFWEGWFGPLEKPTAAKRGAPSFSPCGRWGLRQIGGSIG